MNHSLTEGAPGKVIWRFTLPMLLSVAFQQLYSIIDSMIAGKFINADALAAVGASYPVTMLFIAIAQGANIGTSVIVSSLFGAKQFKKMKTCITTALISITTLALFLTFVGYAVCNPIIALLQTPDNIFDDSATYLAVYMLGLLFMFLYNVCNGIFTAMGDSKTPLYFLILSSVGNIILDLILVIPLKMGVAGVAWATLIAQGFSSILALYYLYRRIHTLRIEGKADLFDVPMLLKISKIAIPSILQQSFVSVGNLLLQGLINSFGSTVIAGYSAAIKLNVFALTCFNTVSNSISSYTAQNLGADKIERVKQGIRVAYKMMVFVALPFVLCYFLFSNTMINLFVSANDTGVIEVGMKFLRIVSPFYLIICLKIVADGVMRGAAEMFPFLLSTLADFVARIGLAFLFSRYWGSTGIWMAWPISWFIGFLITTSYFARGTWERAYRKS
ncbi:MAG: MATE family efflux transporter [Lachnospiraceae bacterium]